MLKFCFVLFLVISQVREFFCNSFSSCKVLNYGNNKKKWYAAQKSVKINYQFLLLKTTRRLIISSFNTVCYVLHYFKTAFRIFNGIQPLFQQDETRSSLEVSPESGVLVQEIAARIEKEGGYSLLIDYGHDGTKTDTFRVSC